MWFSLELCSDIAGSSYKGQELIQNLKQLNVERALLGSHHRSSGRNIYWRFPRAGFRGCLFIPRRAFFLFHQPFKDAYNIIIFHTGPHIKYTLYFCQFSLVQNTQPTCLSELFKLSSEMSFAFNYLDPPHQPSFMQRWTGNCCDLEYLCRFYLQVKNMQSD